MRRIESLADVQIVLRDLLDFQTKIENSGLDLHGLRVRNANDGSADGDYVTLKQLKHTDADVTQLVNDLANLKGLSVIVHFAGGFTVGTATYHDLVFQDGVLKILS